MTFLKTLDLIPSYTRQTENDIASGKLDPDGQHGKVILFKKRMEKNS